jgi:diguanylate cyclase (GGDEF)-like protein
LHALVAGLAARFAYRYVSVFLVEEGGLRLRAQVGYAAPIPALALGEGITGLVAREGRPTLVRDGRRHPGYLAAEAQIGSQVSVPLTRAGRVLGVLNLEGGVGELCDADLRLLAALAAPAAVAIENAALVARLTAQATRDPLTGLLNRRGILAAPDAALSRAGAAAPVSVLLVDLNGFKGINDRYGHATGDRVLTGLAGLLATSMGAAAAVGRLGGDEFLVVLPGTDAATAGTAVDRLTAALAVYPSPARCSDDAPPPLGYSLGLATATASGADAAALLARADRAMYDAKHRCVGSVRFLPAAMADDRLGV